jgi:DNA-binding LacI/PurR family transcriptional regulator
MRQDVRESAMIVCPYCQRGDQQVKAGKNAGAQRYKCRHCRRRYTPDPVLDGYSSDDFSSEGRQCAVLVHSPDQNEKLRNEKLAVPAEMLPVGKRRRTIQDVALEAGVSTSTISNFLNQKGRMSEATKVRIQEAIDTLHFTPSALMRALRQRRTGILGVYMFGLSTLDHNVGGSLAPPLLAGISQAADAAAHHLLLYTGWEQSSVGHDIQQFLDGHIDGLIWVAPELETSLLDQLAAAGLPVIAVLTRHVPVDVGYINLDNIGAVRDLVLHLHGLGHRRIAYAGPLDQSNYIDRSEGYRQGLHLADLPFQPLLEATGPGAAWPFLLYPPLLDRWLALPEPPTAIIVQDDGAAAHMIELLQARGLRVPEDMAVTGFDDIPDASRSDPPLTTIQQPFHEMGQLAVERLLALAAGSPVEECRVTVPGRIITRASTVPAPPPYPPKRP